MKRKVLVITSELLPLPGKPVAGGGLRVKGLVEALKGGGHEVIVSMPASVAQANQNLPDEYKRYSHEPERLTNLVLEIMPQVVLVEQWGLASYLDPDLPIPLVIDLHGPLSLENSFKIGSGFLSDALTKIETLGKADLLLCPGRIQKAYFLSWFLMAGASPICPPIVLIPLGMPPDMPKKKTPEKVTMVFGGIAWPWIDPFPGLRIAAEILAKRGGELNIYSGPPPVISDHPLYSINRNIGRQYEKDLLDISSVNMRGRIPHAELIDKYLSATAAFDLYKPNPERELAVTTRTLEYLWCGLPVIYGHYGELSFHIREYGCGFVLDPDDEAGIAAAVSKLFDDPHTILSMCTAAQKLVADRFTWTQGAGPLLAFVQEPSKRAKEPSLISGFRDYYRKESDSKIREGKEKIGELHEEMRKKAEKFEQERKTREIWFAQEFRKKERLIETWRDKAEKIQKEISDKIGDLERQAAEQTELLSRAEQRFAALEQTAEQRRLRIVDLEVQIARLQDRAMSAEREKRDLAFAADALRSELSKISRHAGDLSAEIHRLQFEHEVQQRTLDGFRNAPGAAFKARLQMRAKKLFIRLPKLAWLLIVNLFTNSIMLIHEKRTGRRIFPGTGKPGKKAESAP